MPPLLQTTYRYRLAPTAEQERQFSQFAGARRFVWNWALARSRDHFRQTGTLLSFAALSAELTLLKQQPETAWLREMHAQSLQQALRDLHSAYQHFFRRVRTGEKRKGFPRFKSRKTDTPRFRMPQDVRLDGSFVSVPKLGRVRAIVHRVPHGTIKSATFKREACGQWYVSFVTEHQAVPSVARSVHRSVGIDLGLVSLAVLSTGEVVGNPRWYRQQMCKLRRAQRALGRKQKGSRNREKGRVAVARLHQKTRNQRSDFLHKLSTRLVGEYDLIAIEDLNVRGLARAKLSTSVLDAGWGMFRAMLRYKAARASRHLVVIGRFFPSSKTCGVCGRVNDSLTRSERVWRCRCGAEHDRDRNASRLIEREGLRLFGHLVAAGNAETQNACGDRVSPIEMVGTGR